MHATHFESENTIKYVTNDIDNELTSFCGLDGLEEVAGAVVIVSNSGKGEKCVEPENAATVADGNCIEPNLNSGRDFVVCMCYCKPYAAGPLVLHLLIAHCKRFVAVAGNYFPYLPGTCIIVKNINENIYADIFLRMKFNIASKI